uniref:Uncharacterized protein n=1 Tax=Arundo donax TaxID=35708 RepID=A0A0A9B8E5_ARUDO
MLGLLHWKHGMNTGFTAVTCSLMIDLSIEVRLLLLCTNPTLGSLVKRLCC